MHKTLFNFGIKKNIVLYFIIFFITLIFINSFLDRTKPNSDPRLSYKYTYYAIPISISNTLTTLTEDNYHYTQFDNIRKIIYNETHGFNKSYLNSLINFSFEDKPKGEHAHAVPGAEDIGLVDFVTYSFAIFGKNKDSILKFYLLILITSTLIFFLSFYKNDEFYLISISFISLLIIFNENFTYNFISLFEIDRFTDNRNFSILSLIPYLHIFLHFFYKKTNVKNLTLLTIQIIILNFIFFCRASILLEIIFMNIVFVVYLIYKFIKSNESFNIFLSKIENQSKVNIIIILLFCAFILPNGNKLLLTKLYSEFLTDRHPTANMLRAGIIVDNPNLKKKYNFIFNSKQMNIDHAIRESGIKFYKENYNPKEKKQIFYPHGGINIVEQQKMERHFILHLLINDFDEIIKNFIIYKPIKILDGYKTELKHYKTNINFLKIITSLLLFVTFIFLDLKFYKLLILFFLITIPVTIKNMLFWGMTDAYFLDLYIIYNLAFLILIYLIISKIKNSLI